MLLKHKQELFEKVLPSTMLIKGFVKRSQDWTFCKHLCCNIFSTKTRWGAMSSKFLFWGGYSLPYCNPLPLLCCIWVCMQLLYSWVVYWSISKRPYSQLVYPNHNPCKICMLQEQNLESLYFTSWSQVICKLFKHKSTVTAVIKQTSIFYRFPDAKNNRFLTNQWACNISIYYFINMYH